MAVSKGHAALGRARRKQSKIARERKIGMEAISSVGEAAIFAKGQLKKASTAWGEYEAGYKELGGEGFERPKFGQKGYFKGPKGDVTIGKKIYDRGQIQKAGSFLGSDAAAILSDEQRQKYLGRTAPGRWDPSQFTKPAEGPHIYSDVEIEKMTGGGKAITSGISLPGTGGIGATGQNYVTSELASSRTGVYDQKAGIGVTGPDFLKGYQPNLSVAGDTITKADRVQTGRIQMEQQLAAEDLITKKGKATMRQWEKEGELESIRAESKARLSTVGTGMPTFSPEFSQKVETGMTAYSEWEARNAEQQENIRINKAREDELARQFYNQNPKRNAWDAQILNNKRMHKPEMY